MKHAEICIPHAKNNDIIKKDMSTIELWSKYNCAHNTPAMLLF